MLDERYWSRVEKTDTCWLWRGTIRSDGYGLYRREGKQYRVHRLTYAADNGPIPAGLFVCHHCDVRACVNPAHLFLGTLQDNHADMLAKGRQSKGERHGMFGRNQSRDANHAARLTSAKVADIRAMGLAGYQAREIAERFGVNRATIAYVLEGKTWTGVKPSAALLPVDRLSYRAKLTPELAREIRSRYRGRGDFTRLGREYGVSLVAIRMIVLGRSYPED